MTSLLRILVSRSSAFCCSSLRSFSASSSSLCLSEFCSRSSTTRRCVLRSAASCVRFSSASCASSCFTFLSAAAVSAAEAACFACGAGASFSAFAAVAAAVSFDSHDFAASSSLSSATAAAAGGGCFLDFSSAEAMLLRRDTAEADLRPAFSTTGRAPRCSASTTVWWPLAVAMESALSPRLLTRSRIAPRCSSSCMHPRCPV
mmetsp:Transcript_82982/g.213830  ORF Transcript_82982/g.213830 Transcript_82982/m.213830 type:complete len:203 (-) Transcript_82982:381-989(-)